MGNSPCRIYFGSDSSPEYFMDLLSGSGNFHLRIASPANGE